LNRPPQKRRHRKSHGRISFGDLARTIAENWKTVSPKSKSIFEHYAERDSLRYKRELKLWKERKDYEIEATTIAKHSNFMNSMNMSSSLRSSDSTSQSTSDYLDSIPREGSMSTSFNNQRNFSNSMNSSMNSIDPSALHAERDMHNTFHRQQQILQEQLAIDNNLAAMNAAPGSHAFHSSFTSIPSRMAFSVREGSSFSTDLNDLQTMSGGDVGGSDFDPLLGSQGVTAAASAGRSSFQGMSPMRFQEQRLNRSMSDLRSSGMRRGTMGGMMGGMNSFGGMMVNNTMENTSFGGDFSHEQHQIIPSSTNISMMSSDSMEFPHPTSSAGLSETQKNLLEIDRMKRRLELLQQQQRQLELDQTQQQQQIFTPMGNSSATSLQFGDAFQQGNIVSDHSRSIQGSICENANSSFSTFASGVGGGFTGGQLSFGGQGGMGMGMGPSSFYNNNIRSFSYPQQQQQMFHHPQFQQYDVPATHDDSFSGRSTVSAMSASGRGGGMSGSTRGSGGSGPMNISNSGGEKQPPPLQPTGSTADHRQQQQFGGVGVGDFMNH
jgi:hypothetical protein